jgi:ribA/ribD-fused uncharacterized protein
MLLSIDTSTEKYKLSEVVSFLKTKEAFGGLSNMASKLYPIYINGILIDNIEILYQICRYADYPDIQTQILNNKSPMGAKMVSKKYRKQYTRSDFENVKVDIMYWCLRVKLACNPLNFGSLLESTGNKVIVEISRNDPFWGAQFTKDNSGFLVGQNILGKLLMELRSYYRLNMGKTTILKVEPLEIENFKILGKTIGIVVNNKLFSKI